MTPTTVFELFRDQVLEFVVFFGDYEVVQCSDYPRGPGLAVVALDKGRHLARVLGGRKHLLRCGGEKAPVALVADLDRGVKGH